MEARLVARGLDDRRRVHTSKTHTNVKGCKPQTGNSRDSGETLVARTRLHTSSKAHRLDGDMRSLPGDQDRDPRPRQVSRLEGRRAPLTLVQRPISGAHPPHLPDPPFSEAFTCWCDACTSIPKLVTSSRSPLPSNGAANRPHAAGTVLRRGNSLV
jgi:hypothetical protein